MKRLIHHANREEGHIGPAGGGLLGAIGAVALGIGAANDTGWLAVAGGIVAGVGFLVGHIYGHSEVDWKFFDRLDRLEKK